MNPGETLGIVGESGSGKTMTALSLMGLLPQGGKVSSGSIILDGQDLTQLVPESEIFERYRDEVVVADGHARAVQSVAGGREEARDIAGHTVNFDGDVAIGSADGSGRGAGNQKVTGVNFGYVAPDVPATKPKQGLARTGFDGLISGAGLGAAVVGGMFLWMRRRRQD